MAELKKVRKAIIPAAGLGTRVLPATKAMPKEMLPIVDKPAIQYIVYHPGPSLHQKPWLCFSVQSAYYSCSLSYFSTESGVSSEK